MTSRSIRKDLTILALVVLSGCATLPTGPSVLVMPAPGKTIENFQVEDMACRQWAGQQVGISSQEVVNRNVISGAAAGTAIGAGAGALIGAASGHGGAGAAVGAGSGLLVGTAAGASAGQEYGSDAQQRYDFAYVQCMYSKGNQIPERVHRYRIRSISPPPERYPVPPDYKPDYPPSR